MSNVINTPMQDGMEAILSGFQSAVVHKSALDKNHSHSSLSVCLARPGFPRVYLNCQMRTNMKTGLSELTDIGLSHNPVIKHAKHRNPFSDTIVSDVKKTEEKHSHPSKDGIPNTHIEEDEDSIDSTVESILQTTGEI